MAFAHCNFFLRFRPSLSCNLRLFKWRVVLSRGFWISSLVWSMTIQMTRIYSGFVRESVWRMWMDETKMVRLKIVRRSVWRILIGQDKYVVLKIVGRSVGRILIGRDEDVVLKIVQRSVRRILIGRDEDFVLKIVRRSVRRILIRWKRKLVCMTMCLTCPPARLIWLDETESCLIFWDASYWLVRWTCLAETLMIGWSDWSDFSIFFVLLVAQFQTLRKKW